MSSPLGLALHHLRYEQKSYWRNPAAAIFTFALPLMLLVIFTSTFGNQRISVGELAGLRQAQYYLPAILAYGIMSASFVNLAITLTFQRESGALRRLQLTPMPRSSMGLGLVLHVTVICAIMTTLALAFASLTYGTSLTPAKLPALVVAIAVAVLSFTSLGIAVSGLTPNEDSAAALVYFPYLILTFISGGFFQVSGTLGEVSRWLPLRPLIQALLTVFDPRRTGLGWSWRDLAVIAGWGLLGVILATRTFRWEPRR